MDGRTGGWMDGWMLGLRTPGYPPAMPENCLMYFVRHGPCVDGARQPGFYSPCKRVGAFHRDCGVGRRHCNIIRPTTSCRLCRLRRLCRLCRLRRLRCLCRLRRLRCPCRIRPRPRLLVFYLVVLVALVRNCWLTRSSLFFGFWKKQIYLP